MNNAAVAACHRCGLRSHSDKVKHTSQPSFTLETTGAHRLQLQPRRKSGSTCMHGRARRCHCRPVMQTRGLVPLHGTAARPRGHISEVARLPDQHRNMQSSVATGKLFKTQGSEPQKAERHLRGGQGDAQFPGGPGGGGVEVVDDMVRVPRAALALHAVCYDAPAPALSLPVPPAQGTGVSRRWTLLCARRQLAQLGQHAGRLHPM